MFGFNSLKVHSFVLVEVEANRPRTVQPRVPPLWVLEHRMSRATAASPALSDETTACVTFFTNETLYRVAVPNDDYHQRPQLSELRDYVSWTQTPMFAVGLEKVLVQHLGSVARLTLPSRNEHKSPDINEIVTTEYQNIERPPILNEESGRIVHIQNVITVLDTALLIKPNAT
jgi:hypothetical protein